jgi:hypothetical protein
MEEQKDGFNQCASFLLLLSVYLYCRSPKHIPAENICFVALDSTASPLTTRILWLVIVFFVNGSGRKFPLFRLAVQYKRRVL